ncbi:unnamed protein product [Didymodactylos carnosus]|nr:unnamed protein product [Didymodactylos carnosus]CAF3828023.1 unnamed protein product [Didymodactylos carnosus]
MTILLMFNKSSELTIEKLYDETQIKLETLTSVIRLLLKQKVLKCTEITPEQLSEENDLQMASVLKINTNFTNNKTRINLNVSLKSEVKQETEHIHQAIESNRKFVIEAAIVRIMKARKELQHTQLISEVLTMLAPRFKPQVPDIKLCIGRLIEDQHLERVPNERDTYRYLA